MPEVLVWNDTTNEYVREEGDVNKRKEEARYKGPKNSDGSRTPKQLYDLEMSIADDYIDDSREAILDNIHKFIGLLLYDPQNVDLSNSNDDTIETEFDNIDNFKKRLLENSPNPSELLDENSESLIQSITKDGLGLENTIVKNPHRKPYERLKSLVKLYKDSSTSSGGNPSRYSKRRRSRKPSRKKRTPYNTLHKRRVRSSRRRRTSTRKR